MTFEAPFIFSAWSKSTWRANLKSSATLLSTQLFEGRYRNGGWNPKSVDIRTLLQPHDSYPSIPNAIPNALS